MKSEPKETKIQGGRGAVSPLTEDLEAELAGIAAGSGCELANVEWKGGVLRIILDKDEPEGTAPAAPDSAVSEDDGVDGGEGGGPAPAGVSLRDCEQVAKQVSALLDVAEFGNGRYTLEVSSPGLDRQLYRPRDYERFQGRLARVTFTDTTEPGKSSKRTLVGRLDGLDREAAGGAGAVGLVDEKTGERRVISLETIKIARLEIEI